jgi:hypothetical protein
MWKIKAENWLENEALELFKKVLKLDNSREISIITNKEINKLNNHVDR